MSRRPSWRYGGLAVCSLIVGFFIIAMPQAVKAMPSRYEDVPKASGETYHLSEVVRDNAAVLTALHIQLDPADRVSFLPDPALGLGTTVTVQRAPVLTLKDGKRHRVWKSWSPTVAEALTDANIELADLDKVTPARDAKLGGDTTMTIIRVSETDVVDKSAILYDTVTTDDATLEKGKIVVVQEGKNGERTKTYHVRREDGEEVSRKLTSDKITTAPQIKKVKHGTKLPYIASGVATWYTGRGVGPLTAASKTIPKNTNVLVTSMASGKHVIVTINDYGPTGAEIDLSKDAFAAIGDIGVGRMNVKIEKWIPD